MTIANGKRLEDTILSDLQNNMGLNHHIYWHNFYNSVILCENLLQRKTRVCGTMMTKLRNSTKILKKKLKTAERATIINSQEGRYFVPNLENRSPDVFQNTINT
jgi:hypothetical protein